MRYFGMIGANGSGKSTACNFFETKGFQAISLSEMIREEARKSGIPEDRDSLTELANQLKSDQGLAVLAEKSIEHVQKEGKDKVVFDSIRNLAECEALKEAGVVLIGVQVPVELRYARSKERGLERDAVDEETFRRQDDYERSGKSSGQEIDACMEHCDIVIDNDKDLAELEKKLETVINDSGK